MANEKAKWPPHEQPVTWPQLLEIAAARPEGSGDTRANLLEILNRLRKESHPPSGNERDPLLRALLMRGGSWDELCGRLGERYPDPIINHCIAVCPTEFVIWFCGSWLEREHRLGLTRGAKRPGLEAPADANAPS